MLLMARFCRSFFVKTSMLRGTFCRFSSRLRAVTMTSCSGPPRAVSVAAAASSAGARGAATLASAAATATLICEPRLRGWLAGALRKHRAARFGLGERIRATPRYFIGPARAQPCADGVGGSSFERTSLVNDRSIRVIRADSASGSFKASEAVRQCAAQRFKLLLEVTPVSHPRRIQRLANLFGARRAHRAPRLVEAEAGGFESQPAV